MPRTSGTKPKRPSDSQGTGWGGPAKGAGHGSPAAPPVTGTRAGERKKATPAELVQERQARAQLLVDNLFNMAASKRYDPLTRIKATEAFLNREIGMPVARNLNLNMDDVSGLTDEQLNARIAELERRALAAGETAPTIAGSAETPGQEKLDTVEPAGRA